MRPEPGRTAPKKKRQPEFAEGTSPDITIPKKPAVKPAPSNESGGMSADLLDALESIDVHPKGSSDTRQALEDMRETDEVAMERRREKRLESDERLTQERRRIAHERSEADREIEERRRQHRARQAEEDAAEVARLASGAAEERKKILEKPNPAWEVLSAPNLTADAIEVDQELEAARRDHSRIPDMSREARYIPTPEEEAAQKAKTGADIANLREKLAIKRAQADLAGQAIDQLIAEVEPNPPNEQKPKSGWARIKAWFSRKP